MCKQTKERFVLDLTKSLNELIGKKVCINVKEVNKNNDTMKTALNIVKEGDNISRVVYIDSFYEEYCEGRTIESISQAILESLGDEKKQVQDKCKLLMSRIYDYEQIKDTLSVKLINLEKNQEYLKDKIYKEWLDLAICLYARVEDEEEGIATMAIPQKVLDTWDKNKEEVMEAAIMNCQKILPARIKSMDEVLIDLIMDTKDEDSFAGQMNPPTSSNLWILTNNKKINGAAAILYKDVLKKFAEDNEVEEVYIIPSSIHEVILYPITEECDMTIEDLNEMIVEVNDEEVSPDEILGTHAYIYNKADNNIYFTEK